MAIGEANGKSSTFTIKLITIGYPDRLCGRPVMVLKPEISADLVGPSPYLVLFLEMTKIESTWF